jgi:N-acetylmuramoyl-L-alanine amidase
MPDHTDRSPTPRRRFLTAFGGLLLVPVLVGAAKAASIVAVRMWPARDYTRVTLEHEGELEFSQFVLKDGQPRLVVDIKGLDLDLALRELVSKVAPNDPYIASVRVGQNQPHVVRIVFELKQAVVPQVFQLLPAGEYRSRLVLDLYPAQAEDPILGLLRQIEESEARNRLNQIGFGDQPSVVAPPVPSRPPVPVPPPTPVHAPIQPPPVAIAPAPKPTEKPTEPPAKTEPALPRMTRLATIAIDPGHGGEDPGAVGPSGLREKDVVLSIARKLVDRINATPNMRAALTRDGDYFVPLHERVRKARAIAADLFVSVHADAFTNREARGSSVFVLSERGATSATARYMAQKENDSDKVGGVNVAVKDRDVAHALLDMSTAAQIRDSLKLGAAVLDNISSLNRLHKPRVEQAGFAVLKAPDIPSILVETAFISNPEEESRLRDDDFQSRMAEQIYGGIRRYFAKNPPMSRNVPM